MASLTDADIARWRLHSQRLARPFAASADDVIGHLLAVQAENPSQSAWAVATRTETADPADLAGLLDTGTVVRTHVLRSTWHYVRAEDIVWLLEVTAPRIVRVTAQQLVELDDTVRERATNAVLESLAQRSDLTRNELADALEGRGVSLRSYLLMVLLAHLELTGLICSGRPADGQHTYALMSERVPNPRRLEREQALTELARRYFTSHGPATEKDLAYWATLTVTDVRVGLRALGDELAQFRHDGRTYFHAPGDPPAADPEPRGHLLQMLDEMYRGYQDSRYALDVAGQVPRKREPAMGMALVDGQLRAWMKRTVAKNRVDFAITPLSELTAMEVEALEAAAERYGAFLGLEARLTLR